MRQRLIFALLGSTCFLSAVGLMTGAARAAEDKTVPLATDAISEIVTSAKGPEAGVWVIAETDSFKTHFAKIVVTDDQGRYLVPQLPKGKYRVWARGYGLVDADAVEGMPGSRLDLKAVVAPDAKAAAQYYPANYWYSLLRPPAASEFPGTGVQGNGIALGMTTQQEWLANMKEQCLFCHQLGDKATRELANNSVEGWAERIQKARAPGDVTLGDRAQGLAATMGNNIAKFGRERGLKMFADWTDRIAKGELPTEAPARPAGVERNVVLSMWDWGGGRFVHDEITTDKRRPNVNAKGVVYGADNLTANLEVLDPETNATYEIDIPGISKPHNTNAGPHNPMMDSKGRVWMTDISGPEGAYPDYCTNGSLSKFAKYFPNPKKAQPPLFVYDPATKKTTLIPTCFGMHHLNFGYDKDSTLFFSGDANVMGWIDTKVWDGTHDPAKAEGWCPMVLDTKEKDVSKVALGGGDDVKITPDRTQWNEWKKPLDPKKDTRLTGFLYGMNISPVDGSSWYAVYTPAVPSGIVRLERGSNPPETCKTEYYEPPKLADGNYAAYNARGVDINSKDIAWVAFGSGQIGRFDRGKCKVLSGPTAIGQHCPEGWTFFTSPGPKVAETTIGSADWHYLTWVDLHNVLGLGKDVPIVPGTLSDSLLAFLPESQKWITMRVPYPLGFYTRGLDGRIDDAKAGWKGRGLWADYGEVPVWHQEDGEGASGKMVKFQLRPSPLAE